MQLCMRPCCLMGLPHEDMRVLHGAAWWWHLHDDHVLARERLYVRLLDILEDARAALVISEEVVDEVRWRRELEATPDREHALFERHELHRLLARRRDEVYCGGFR